jgi:hypothetical protein
VLASRGSTGGGGGGRARVLLTSGRDGVLASAAMGEAVEKILGAAAASVKGGGRRLCSDRNGKRARCYRLREWAGLENTLRRSGVHSF